MIPLKRNAFAEDVDTRQALAEFVRTTDRLSIGPRVAEFEAAWAARVGRLHGVMTNSGSSANLLLVQTMLNSGHLWPDAAVAFAAVTWPTNVMPMVQLGLAPWPVDCSPATLQMDPVQSWSFATNALGFAPDLMAFDEARLIVDSCEAVTGTIAGRHIGSFGLATTFSFFVGHHLSTIEGGMVCTDSDDLADHLRAARANGWDRDMSSSKREVLRDQWCVDNWDAQYTFYAPAFNVRPTEIQGWLGCRQLRYLDAGLKRRHQIWRYLAGEQRIGTVVQTIVEDAAPLGYPVMLASPGERAITLEVFARAGVETRPMIAGNITRQPFWRWTNGPLPGASVIGSCGFYCGLFPEMTDEDVETIARCLR